MSIDRRVLAGTLGLALIVAACGGSSSSPAASASPAPSQAAESTAPSSQAPTESTGPEPSFTAGAASELEAMLPDSAGGVTFTKQSFSGADLGAAAGVGVDTGELDPILKANGKTVADVRAAIASPATPSATNTAMIFAIQVQGMDATKLIPLLATGSDTTFTPATIAGKQVLQSGTTGFNVVIYTKGDVLFDVFLASDSVLQAVLAALP